MEHLRESMKGFLDTYIASIKNEAYDGAIAVMTDMHTEEAESYAVMNYMACSGAVDLCVTLGDAIATRYDTREEALAMLRKEMDLLHAGGPRAIVYPLRGNHDVNPVRDFDVAKMVSNREYFQLSGSGQKPGYAGPDKNYGFYDLEKAKVRVILFDSADIFDDDGRRLSTNNETMFRQEQFHWLSHTALDLTGKERPGEWAVMLFSHAAMDKLCPDAFRALLDAFTEGKAAEGEFPYDSAGYAYTLRLEADFTRQGPGQFICAVSGHEHRDMEFAVGRHKEISLVCDLEGCYRVDEQGAWHWYTRTPGTAEEHAFDTVLLDRKTKTAVFRRFGLGTDRVITWGK